MKVEHRPRCKRCGKLPRGKIADRYAPYCSYDCQQWHGLEQAMAHLKTLPKENSHD